MGGRSLGHEGGGGPLICIANIDIASCSHQRPGQCNKCNRFLETHRHGTLDFIQRINQVDPIRYLDFLGQWLECVGTKVFNERTHLPFVGLIEPTCLAEHNGSPDNFQVHPIAVFR